MVDPVMDEQLAMFVVESHRRSHPSTAPPPPKGAGGGDDEGDDDNTAIINDKVGAGLESEERVSYKTAAPVYVTSLSAVQEKRTQLVAMLHIRSWSTYLEL